MQWKELGKLLHLVVIEEGDVWYNRAVSQLSASDGSHDASSAVFLIIEEVNQ